MTCSVLHKIQKPHCIRGTYSVKNRLCKKTFTGEGKEIKGENCIIVISFLPLPNIITRQTTSLQLDHGHRRKQAWEVRTNGTFSPGFLEQRGGRQRQRKNEAVKFPFDTMGKGVERVSNEKKGIVGMSTLTTLWFW